MSMVTRNGFDPLLASFCKEESDLKRQIRELNERFIIAVDENNMEEVKASLNDGADVHFKHESALLLVIQRSNYEMTKYLLQHGIADPHARYGKAFKLVEEKNDQRFIELLSPYKTTLKEY